MYSVRKTKVMCFLLCLILCLTLIPDMGFAQESQPQEKEAIQPEDVTKKDVIKSELTKDETSYDLGGGKKMTVYHGGDVRYKDENGALVDYDASLVKIPEGEKSEQKENLGSYAYENKQGDYKQYLPEILSERTPILMESGKKQITFTPTDQTLKGMSLDAKSVKVKKELVPTIYEQEAKRPIDAIYGSEEAKASLTYTSGEFGVKEKLTLSEKPTTNVFEYKVNLKGMDARKNVTTEGITFYDQETGEIAADIAPAWMNDASEKAYSEDITYDLTKQEGSEDSYLLTMTISQAYLDDPDRKWPVTVDPTVTWVGSSKVRDAYVISGSTYGNTNFYESGTKIMPAGKNSTGTHRTLVKFIELEDKLKSQSITRARLIVYETGSGASKQKVTAKRITSSWVLGSVTYNKQPSYGGAYASITTKKTAGSAHAFVVTTFARSLAASTITNHGLLLYNTTSSPSYAAFYGSRTTSSTKRPKMVVEYKAPPTTATKVSASPVYMNGSAATSVSWTGISSTTLQKVQYRVAQCNSAGTVTNANFVPYSTLKTTTASSGTVSIAASKTWAAGRYIIYVRGVDTAGAVGTGKGVTVYMDKTKPANGTRSITPVSTEAAPSSVKEPTITWSGITDTYLKAVQYAVNGGGYKTAGTSAAGSFKIPQSEFAESGTQQIKVRAIDHAGNINTETSHSYYLDKLPPGVSKEHIQLFSAPDEKINGIWTKETNPTISFSNVQEEHSSIVAAGIQYAMVNKQNANGSKTFKTPSDLTLSNSAEGYEGSFKLTAADQQCASGTYNLFVRFTDICGNTTEMAVEYKKDTMNPTGEILISAMGTGEIEAGQPLEDTVNISAFLQDEPAEAEGTLAPTKIKKATLSLIDPVEDEVVKVINQDQDLSNMKAEDTTKIKNGQYQLVLAIEDMAGNQNEITREVQIANKLKAPKITAAPTNTRSVSVSWSCNENISKVQEIEYKIGEGEWEKQEIDEAHDSGDFSVEVPDTEGTYDAAFRFVDKDGLAGKPCNVNLIVDKTAPAFSNLRIDRGILYGEITDDRMDGYELFVSAGEGDFEKVPVEGADRAEQILGVLDLSDIEVGAEFQVKVQASDKADNQSEMILTEEKTDDHIMAAYIPKMFEIESTSADEKQVQIKTSMHQLLLQAVGEYSFAGKELSWYINNAHVESTGNNNQALDADLSSYAIDTPHGILATDGEGYSTDLFKNKITAAIELQESDQVSGEAYYVKEMILGETFVSFRLLNEHVDFEVSLDGEQYVAIDAGQTCIISQLDSEKIESDRILVKATLKGGKNLSDVGSIQIGADVPQQQTLTRSSVEDYAPEQVTATDKINYKTYVKWQTPKDALPENLSFEVYRGDTADFDLEDGVRIAEGIKDHYFSDLNLSFGKTFFYKVRVVKIEQTADGAKVIGGSNLSEAAESTVVDAAEYTKRMGEKDYFSYEEVDTPSGFIKVEKSAGNLVYTQTDAKLANEMLPMELTRTYNNQSSAKSAFGMGWNHNYDIELLTISADNTNQFDEVALKDETGTIFTFKKVSGNKYVSSMAKYMNLYIEEDTKQVEFSAATGERKTMEVKSAYKVKMQDIEYWFNSGGQLVCMTEKGGKELIFTHDGESGYLQQVTTGKALSIQFKYEDGKVSEIALPDQSKVLYEYSGDYLNQVTRQGYDGLEISYDYDYELLNGKNLKSLTDGEGNAYTFDYDHSGNNADNNKNSKVTEISSPDQSKVELDYHAEETATAVKYFDKHHFLYQENSYFTKGTGHHIGTGKIKYEEKSISESMEAEGDWISKTVYKNDVPITESRVGESQSLSENGTINFETNIVTEQTRYNDTGDATMAVDEEGNTMKYVYGLNGEGYESYVTSEQEKDADGDVVTDLDYDYDEDGNEISVDDAIDGSTIDNEFLDEEDEEALTEDDEEDFVGEIKREETVDGNGLERTTDYTYSYDNDGNKVVVATEHAAGREAVTTEKYDLTGNLIYKEEKVDGKLLSSTTSTFDSFGRLTKTEEVQGDIKTIMTRGYDKNGAMITEFTSDEMPASSAETPEGTDTSYTYDHANNLTGTITTKGGETKVSEINQSYTSLQVHTGKGYEEVPLALLETTTDGNEIVGQTFTDPEGNVRREIADGVCQDYAYDKDGKQILSSITGEEQTDKSDGRLEMKLYDTAGNETHAIMNPQYVNGKFKVTKDSIVTSKTYDSTGKVLTNTDALGNETKFEYDTTGDLHKVIAPEGAIRTYQYNQPAGDGIAKHITIDAKGNRSEEHFNVNQQVLETVDLGDGSVDPIKTVNQYDERGNTIKTTDSEGNRIESEYSLDGKDKGVDYYDKAGNLKFRTENVYDSKGRLVSMRDYREVKAGESTSGKTLSKGLLLYRYTHYGYDSTGRETEFAELDTSTLPEATDIEKRLITYTYDIHENLTEISYGEDLGNVESLEFSYNKYMKLTDITANTKTGDGTLREYSYDAKGRIESTKDYTDFAEGGIILSHKWKKCEFTYDQFDRQTKLSYTDSENGDKVMESYSLAYDKNGNIIKEEMFNDYPSEDSALANKDLITEDDILVEGDEDGGDPTEPDPEEPDGETTEPTEPEDGTGGEKQAETGKQNEVRHYTYDNLGQLIKVEIEDQTDGKTIEKEYAYDVVGNRISEKEGGETRTLGYNSLNQLITSTALSGEGEEPETGGANADLTSNEVFTYDQAGNQVRASDQVTGTSTEMRYDPAGRLSEAVIKKGDKVALTQTNLYNGDGQRVEKRETISGQEEATAYFYQNGSVLYTKDAEDTLSAFNLLGLTDNILATERYTENDTESTETEYYFYNKDFRGSTTNLLTGTMDAASSYKYDAFGNTQIYAENGNDHTGNEICYTAGIYDGTTKLYYLNARYYSAEDGNFISQDSYRGEDEAQDTWNLYTYCGNSPISYIDPSGHGRVNMPGVKYAWLSYPNMLQRVKNAKNGNKTSKKRLKKIKKEHYARNKKNYQPKYNTMKDEKHIAGWSKGMPLYEPNWRRRTGTADDAHQFPPGQKNKKYTHYLHHYEAVYTKDNLRVENPANIATYNFGHPGKEHTRLDVNSYVWLGNTSADPIGFKERFGAVEWIRKPNKKKKDEGKRRYAKSTKKKMKAIAKYYGRSW